MSAALAKKICVFALAAIFLSLAPQVCAASFQLTTRTISQGAGSGSSPSYNLFGLTRTYYSRTPGSANLVIGEGFMRTAYFTVLPPILAPLVTAITPNSGVNTGLITITNLSGANFLAGATVKLTKSGQPAISAAGIIVVSSTKITCTFDLTGATGGLWDVTVTNPNGKAGTLPSAFAVTYAAPTIISITPDSGVNNAAINITNLAGTNFRSGAAVKLAQTGQADIKAKAVSVVSSTQITCSFDLNGKATGKWDVVVTNDDGQSGTLTSGFKIESPTIELIKPPEFTVTPNPEYPDVKGTTIKYNLSKDADIIIDIYSIRGEKIWSTTAPAGTAGGTVGLNETVWNGLTAFKTVAGAGVYLVFISSRSDGQTKLLYKQKLGIIK